MSDDIHAVVAAALNWRTDDVRAFSLASLRDIAKHRKGLLDLAKQPLGGCWKVAGKTASVIVSTGSRNARRVLSYCNHAGIELAIEGAPIDVGWLEFGDPLSLDGIDGGAAP